MPRTHGYSLKGKRCYGQYDWHSKKRTNVIGAIKDNNFVALGKTESTVTGDIFHSWVKDALLPNLKEISVLVMDNAPFHKPKRIAETIEEAGHIILWLPSYSPDLNKIEHKWGQEKALRRKKRCSTEELFEDRDVIEIKNPKEDKKEKIA